MIVQTKALDDKNLGVGSRFLRLRNVPGRLWNHKRVYSLCCAPELNLRIKPRNRLKRHTPDALPAPDALNMAWSIDFAARVFGSRRTGWVMVVHLGQRNVLDDFNREDVGIEVDFSLPAERVI